MRVCPWRGSHAEGKHECTCKGVSLRCSIDTAAATSACRSVCSADLPAAGWLEKWRRYRCVVPEEMLQVLVNVWLQAVRAQ